MSEVVLLGGSLLGIAAITYATFTVVSYQEVKRKIDEQILRGEDPYELQVTEEKRRKPGQKKKQKRKS